MIVEANKTFLPHKNGRQQEGCSLGVAATGWKRSSCEIIGLHNSGRSVQCSDGLKGPCWPEGEERGASLSEAALRASSSALPPSPQTQLPPRSAKAHQLRLHSVSSGRLTWCHLHSCCCRSSSDLTRSILPLTLLHGHQVKHRSVLQTLKPTTKD